LINKAKNGDGEALYAIDDSYFDKKDYKSTIIWARPSAEKDHVEAVLQICYTRVLQLLYTSRTLFDNRTPHIYRDDIFVPVGTSLLHGPV
jgi:hypothetical protein